MIYLSHLAQHHLFQLKRSEVCITCGLSVDDENITNIKPMKNKIFL